MKLVNTRIQEELLDFANFIQGMFKVPHVSVVFYVEIEGDLDLEELQRYCPKVVALREEPPVYTPDDAAGEATT